jgi:hypothetical protein
MKTLMKELLACMLFLLLFGVNVTAYATSPADPEIDYQYAVSNENIIQSSLDENAHLFTIAFSVHCAASCARVFPIFGCFSCFYYTMICAQCLVL